MRTRFRGFVLSSVLAFLWVVKDAGAGDAPGPVAPAPPLDAGAVFE
jgi:hypothetical protein